MKGKTWVAGTALAVMLGGLHAWAQVEPADEKAKAAGDKSKSVEWGYAKPSVDSTQTFYLRNIGVLPDSNEVVNALRNILQPSSKMFLVPSQNAIVITTTPDQLALAQKLLKDLDRPKSIYHLTYTITESDSGKRIGVQHFSELVASGGRTTTKQGSKIPIITGTYTAGASAQQQATYLDVGINIDASVDELANGVRLKSKIEQSSVAEDRSSVGPQDPVIRQTVIEGTSILTVGKPQILGSVDVAGSTRHLDVEVVLEPVK
ncbi:type II/III secretion system short domain-containing protein [Granulicella rosea]|uniref:Type II/III secretion system short domain-containing protein n=1 Tax=Granulicella rosea TaxID=474952 RepID=A0A239LNL9_9BACT|nr:secretin N-terminal domain-containing protein [Granulicella rosea]SNT31279.1 type II/III secretion system short domain-containing protein [Granulicella rosea]